MVRKFQHIIALVISLTLWFTGESVAQNITFGHLTTDNGLSQSSVNSLYRDERGFIWIGTREGLNRYNSNGIKTFKHSKGDPTSLFCNTVLRITGDSNGNLYLLCSEGVSHFDISLDRFRTLYHGSASAICYDDGLYIAIHTDLYRCDLSNGTLTLSHSLPKTLNDEIVAIYRDFQGTLWLGTHRNGLFGITPRGEMIHPFDHARITSIYEDSAHRLWVGTWEAGLYMRNEQGEWTNRRKQADGLCSDFVRCFIEDDHGMIWIGTFLGLNRYDPSSQEMERYVADGSPRGLTHSSVWSLAKDHQGTIWVGTYFGGVNFFNPEYEIYTRYKASLNPSEGLSSPIVGRMIEDKDHNLWICTEGGGVNVMDRRTGRFRQYAHQPDRNSISHDNVKAICYDERREVMWIGTHLGGLNRLDLNTGRFTHYRFKADDPQTISSDIVRDIVLHDDHLIVATQEGVCFFDPETGKARRMFRNSREGLKIGQVASLKIDRRGTLWFAATGAGLYAYNFETRKLTRYHHDSKNPGSLSSNNINSIVEDRDGNLWLATSGTGLDRYRYETDDFENFDSRKNGLSSDCIYDLRDAGNGELLVITNEGFSIFDPKDHRFENHIRINGFPLTAINENAICLTHDGTVFLGGTQGMVSFRPEALKRESKPYKIIPNRLLVNGQPVEVGDQTGILQKSLCHSRRIRIGARYSVFTVEFATSNFLPANHEDLVYRLDGFSDIWTPTRGQHEITYTNLNPGLYTLLIRSTRQSRAQVPELRLEIEILPPFYRTTWAWMIYILVSCGILWALIRTYKARIRLQESLRYEKQHTRDLEELNQSKLRFFTNISHEFRTPLTLIMGQVEMLLQVQSFSPTIYNKILRVYKNCTQLKELISELLDFRKQELGHMKIRARKQDMVGFLYENFLIFREYSDFRGVELVFDKQDDEIEAWFDRKQMQKVVNNLLSNAFKHTPARGRITLWVRREQESVRFGVSDSGRGIPREQIDKIFMRYYQVDDPKQDNTGGTGIGLALTKGIVELHHGSISVSSEPDKGSTFTVSLPLGRAHFTPEQLAAEEENREDFSTEYTTPEQAFALEKEELDEKVYRRLHGARMLIVEDNDSLREMLVKLCEPFYEVFTAADGEEGWEQVQKVEPQIVISDVVMPRLSGTELCQRIKDDINTCHIPVVLLTARTAPEHMIEGLRTGADDYITKPFNTILLLSRCNNLVNSRLVLREKFSRQPEQSARMLATNAKDQELINRATQIIDKHLDDPEFKIEVFSREMGMARTNLFSKIKAITGSTPNEFIQTIRLKKAASLLANNPELNVSDIADRTGFSSAHYFSKCFKSQFKLSPLTYRKESVGSTLPDSPPEPEEPKKLQDPERPEE